MKAVALTKLTREAHDAGAQASSGCRSGLKGSEPAERTDRWCPKKNRFLQQRGVRELSDYGERRWLAALKLGKPLKVRKYPEVSTVEQRDAIGDSLGENTDPISVVERAWNYARRVIKINTDEDYTPQELQEMRENEYEHLITLADAQTGGPNGTKPSVFSELARQLSKRSGKDVKRNTIQAQTRIRNLNLT